MYLELSIESDSYLWIYNKTNPDGYMFSYTLDREYRVLR